MKTWKPCFSPNLVSWCTRQPGVQPAQRSPTGVEVAWQSESGLAFMQGRQEEHFALGLEEGFPKSAVQDLGTDHIQVVFEALPPAQDCIPAPAVTRTSFRQETLDLRRVAPELLQAGLLEPIRKCPGSRQI